MSCRICTWKLEVSSSPSLSLAELPSDMAKIALDLSDALRREARLKVKVQELTAVLEKVSRNSDARQQQSAGFVNELKRANRWKYNWNCTHNSFSASF